MMGDSCFLARTGAGGGDGAVAALNGSAERSTADDVVVFRAPESVSTVAAATVGRFRIFVLIRSMVPKSDIERFASLPLAANGLFRSPASLTLLVNFPAPPDVDRLFGAVIVAAVDKSADDRYRWPPCRCSSHDGCSLFLIRFFGLSNDMYDESLPTSTKPHINKALLLFVTYES